MSMMATRKKVPKDPVDYAAYLGLDITDQQMIKIIMFNQMLKLLLEYKDYERY